MSAVQAGTKRPLGDPDGDKLGANGLLRMKGGNPEGQPCIDHARGKCQRAKCSFSHEGKPKKGPKAEEEEVAGKA